MNINKWSLAGAVLLVIGIGAGGYYAGRQNSKAPATSKTATKDTSSMTKPLQKAATVQTPTPTTPVPLVINSYDVAGLFNASYTRKMTDFTAWNDSPVSKEYRDFNSDGIMDVAVWAKLPGTGGYSTAAVWTVADGQPKELWHMSDDLILGHSTWSVTSSNGLENKSLKSDGTTDTVHTFHWQVSTTGQGFVLEPSS